MRYFLVVGGVALAIIFLIRLQNGLSPAALVSLEPGVIRYVPLGDSYTIGEGVATRDSWPEVLTRDLNDHGVKVRLVTNPAWIGWTTQELIDNELPIFGQSSPGFTTILVGVNDFNRGVPIETFKKNLGIILDRVEMTKAILITIPDFSVTPTGKTYGDQKYNAKGVQKFNEVIKAEAQKRGLPVVDVFPLSQQMGNDSSLVAGDGLHPSAKEYKLWEQQIFPVARELLRGR